MPLPEVQARSWLGTSLHNQADTRGITRFPRAQPGWRASAGFRLDCCWRTMRPCYPLVAAPELGTASGLYRAEALDTEGFSYCSHADQLARVANLFDAEHAELLTRTIDSTGLTHAVREEEGETSEHLPYVYGATERESVVAFCPLERNADGPWVFDRCLVCRRSPNEPAS